MGLAQRPLALTLGDPAGIGPDITLLAYAARAREDIPPFVLLGDEAVLAARADALGLSVPLATVTNTNEAADLFAGALPVLPIEIAGEVVAGRPDLAAMPAVKQSIEAAVSLVRDGSARAVVTNPISKSLLYQVGFTFPGHTEFLAALAHCSDADASLLPVMMLAAGPFRVVPVTIHIPLKDVPATLTKELLLATIRTTDKDLRRFFGLVRPRLAVTGLNPHAGEDGSLGREEIDIIAPAIDAARAEG
ncbi:MAG: 4-hydroxythreonine-4-phosphate dehydrogenase PdxA, partial [Methyloceanibacter sp.]